MEAAKKQHMRHVYINLIWAIQTGTGEYKTIDLLIDSKLQKQIFKHSDSIVL